MPLTSNIGTSNSLLGNIGIGLGAPAVTGTLTFTVSPNAVSVITATMTGSVQFTITLSASSATPSNFIITYVAALGNTPTIYPTSLTIPAGQLVGVFIVNCGIISDYITIHVSSVENISPTEVDSVLSLSIAGFSPAISVVDAAGGAVAENLFSPTITVVDAAGGSIAENFITQYTSIAPAIVDYAGVSFGSIAVSGGTKEEFGILPAYLSLTSSVTSQASGYGPQFALTLKDTATGAIATFLTLRGGQAATYLTLKDTATGSINTFAWLVHRVTGSIDTKLTLKDTAVGGARTALVIFVPFPYTPTQQVGSDISNLLQDQRTNARYRGSRETIKLATPLRGAEKDLFTAEQTSVGKSAQISSNIEVFRTSYDSSIRSIQKYRVQINWRVKH